VTAVLAATNVVPSGTAATRAVGAFRSMPTGAVPPGAGTASVTVTRPGRMPSRSIPVRGSISVAWWRRVVQASGTVEDERVRPATVPIACVPSAQTSVSRPRLPMGNGAWGPTHDDVVSAWDVLLVLLEGAASWGMGKLVIRPVSRQHTEGSTRCGCGMERRGRPSVQAPGDHAACTVRTTGRVGWRSGSSSNGSRHGHHPMRSAPDAGVCTNGGQPTRSGGRSPVA
jgi:hypothetical protein